MFAKVKTCTKKKTAHTQKARANGKKILRKACANHATAANIWACLTHLKSEFVILFKGNKNVIQSEFTNEWMNRSETQILTSRSQSWRMTRHVIGSCESMCHFDRISIRPLFSVHNSLFSVRWYSKIPLFHPINVSNWDKTVEGVNWLMAPWCLLTLSLVALQLYRGCTEFHRLKAKTNKTNFDLLHSEGRK